MDAAEVQQNTYQKQVHEWADQLKVPYWGHHEIMTRLSEEVGELAREVSHKFGPKKKKASEKDSSMEEEIGDILFTITCLCNKEGINLDETFKIAMSKCYGRDKDRFEKR
jgi:NTP pyrophosphatase (non-canonical NTP hydrolase)